MSNDKAAREQSVRETLRRAEEARAAASMILNPTHQAQQVQQAQQAQQAQQLSAYTRDARHEPRQFPGQGYLEYRANRAAERRGDRAMARGNFGEALASYYVDAQQEQQARHVSPQITPTPPSTASQQPPRELPYMTPMLLAAPDATKEDLLVIQSAPNVPHDRHAGYEDKIVLVQTAVQHMLGDKSQALVRLSCWNPPGDGSCYVHAMVCALGFNKNESTKLRDMAVRFALRKNKTTAVPWIEHEFGEVDVAKWLVQYQSKGISTLRDWAALMKKSDTHFDEIGIRALAAMTGACVVIFYYSSQADGLGETELINFKYPETDQQAIVLLCCLDGLHFILLQYDATEADTVQRLCEHLQQKQQQEGLAAVQADAAASAASAAPAAPEHACQGNNSQVELERFRSGMQQLAAEKQQLAAEKQQLEAEKQQLEAEKQQLEAKNKQLVAEKQQLEAEKQQLEAKNKQLEADKMQASDAMKCLEGAISDDDDSGHSSASKAEESAAMQTLLGGSPEDEFYSDESSEDDEESGNESSHDEPEQSDSAIDTNALSPNSTTVPGPASERTRVIRLNVAKAHKDMRKLRLSTRRLKQGKIEQTDQLRARHGQTALTGAPTQAAGASTQAAGASTQAAGAPTQAAGAQTQAAKAILPPPRLLSLQSVLHRIKPA